MSETNSHPWSHDPARDAAARREEPVTETIMHRDLPEAVAAIERRVEGLEAVAEAWRQRCEREADAASVTPQREAEPVSRAGVNAGGLRTERVTLQVTHVDRRHVSALDWPYMVANYFHHFGESVRVVEEAAEITRLTDERDAAIRERDEARAEIEEWSRRCARVLDERDALREKIVVMEGQSRMDTEKEIAVEEAWERCGIAPHWPDDEPGTSNRYAESMRLEIVRLRARVAELEAAAAANAGGEPQPPRGLITKEERDAVRWIIDFARHHAVPSAAVAHCHFETAEALLARSTPPRVRRPHLDDLEADERPVWESACEAWIAAIREAGGEVVDE